MSLKIETPATRAQFEQMLRKEEREFAKELDEERALLPKLKPLKISEKETQELLKREWATGAKIQAIRDAEHERTQAQAKTHKIASRPIPSPAPSSDDDDSDDDVFYSAVDPDKFQWIKDAGLFGLDSRKN